MDVSALEISQIVIHDVPLPTTGADVILTDAEIELDADLRAYFRDKIVESLSNRGLDVGADPEAPATVRDGVATLLANHEALVPVSQELARHLFATQNMSNSEGLLAVALGTLKEERVVSVLKLEREEGLRLQILQDHGRTLVDIEHLRNLTLTDKTKVFKTSILSVPGRDALSLIGRVSDDQRGLRAKEGVATFFLSRFLGCRLLANPEITTRNWIDGVESFINELSDQERQAEYHIALLATLQDQNHDISPSSFATANLREKDRPAYRDALAARGVDHGASFEKDLKLARAKGFKWYFQHGMTLIGKRDDVDSGRVRVSSPEATPGAPSVELFDSIRLMKGL